MIKLCKYKKISKISINLQKKPINLRNILIILLRCTAPRSRCWCCCCVLTTTKPKKEKQSSGGLGKSLREKLTLFISTCHCYFAALQHSCINFDFHGKRRRTFQVSKFDLSDEIEFQYLKCPTPFFVEIKSDTLMNNLQY